MDEQFYDSNNYNNPYETPSQEIPVYTPPTPKKREKKNRMGLRICALALVFALLGGALGAGGVIWYESSRGQTGTTSKNETAMLQGIRENSVLSTVTVDTGKEMTAAEVYAANVNSTVGITTSITTNYWGFQTTSAAAGSGFILTEDGYILTNYHVVENSNSITVAMYNGDTYDATLIGYDESNDVAVLKVDAEGLSPVVLGDSDNLNVGDSVVAIGNPLGELTFSLTAGLVSAKDREVTLSNSLTMDLIQTDCAINSGNSGGALFNLYGEVIGITNAKYSSSSSSSTASIDNIGFAIPINHVLSIAKSIIEKGYISKPYVGVSVSDVNQQTQLYGIPAGAAVQAVSDGSPAAEAGLQAGDVITRVNGTEITGSSDLVSLVSEAAIGDTLAMTVYRQGSTMELTVTVGEQVQSALANEQTQQAVSDSPSGGWNSYPFGGRRKSGCFQTAYKKSLPDDVGQRLFVLQLFPVIQCRHQRFHMGANLLLRPAFACHVLCAEIDQLFLAGIGKFPVRVAPLAVFLVERAVGFPAEGGILQRHSAALTDQLPGRTQQRVDGNVVEFRQQLQRFHIRRRFPVFPAGHCLPRDENLFRQLVLRQSLFCS